MIAVPRDPSRVREAKPYGPALDCSLAAVKTTLGSTRRMSLARKGTFLLGLDSAMILLVYRADLCYSSRAYPDESGLEPSAMLHSIRELCRFRVLATDGKVGRAEDFYLTDPGCAVRFVVVQTGRLFPGQRVLVPTDYLGVPNGGARVLPIALTKRELERCATSSTLEPVHRQQELLIEDSYGGAARRRGGGPLASVHGVVSRQALEIAAAAKAGPEGEPSEKETPRLRSAQEVIGYQLEALDGPLGAVEDFLVDDQSWAVQYMVVDSKDWRSPNPRVLLAPNWIQHVSWAESRVHVLLTREKIRGGQRYEPGSHSPSENPKPFLWP